MFKEGATAHTSYGTGTIQEVEQVRGSTSYRVAGRGFDVWVDSTKIHVASDPYLAGLDATIEPATDVNEDNYAVLPYNPEPQNHVDLFRHEQNIRPGEFDIDPDERLHSSEDGESRSPNRPSPGPAPHLFASADDVHVPPGADPEFRRYHDWKARGGFHPMPEGLFQDHDQHGERHEASYYYADADAGDDEFGDGPESPDWGDDQWHSDLPDGPERTFGKDAGQHWDQSYGYDNAVGELGEHGKRQLGWQGDGPHKHERPESGGGDSEGRHYRPAGLSGRYAHFDIEANDGLDPVSQFRRDPVSYIHTAGYVSGADDGDYLDQKFGSYTHLLDSDRNLRTAAWHDVRNKAMRLRHDGKVKVHELGPQGIYATVEGDNGTYDTMVAKTGAMGGYGGAQSVANWHCGCEWGRWAFKRKMTFVGRLCSHAYAAYLDMQSAHAKEDPSGYWKKSAYRTADITDKFKSWADDNNEGHLDEGSISDFINTSEDAEGISDDDVNKLFDYLLDHEQEAPERDYDVPYTLDNDEAYKTAAEGDATALRLRPKSLTPDFRVVPEKGDNEWMDVEKDDRKTTGPGQIMTGAYSEPPQAGDEAEPDLVHFSSRWVESLHRTAEPGDWNDQMNTMGQDRQGPAGAPAPPNSNTGRPYNSETGQYGDLDSSGKQDQPYVPEPTPGGGQWKQPGYAGPDPTIGMPGRVNTPELHPAQGATTLDQAFAGGTTQQGKPTDPNAVRAQNNGEVAKSTGAPAGQAGATTDTAPGGAASGAPGGGSSGWKENTDQSGIGQGGTYHVNQGDTLSDIAGRAGLGKDNYQQIADANKDKITDPNHIETGWDLKIPGQPAGQAGTTTGQNPFSSMPNPDGSQSKFHGDGTGTEPAPAAPNPFSSMPNPNGTQSQFHGDGTGTEPPKPPAVPPVPGQSQGQGKSGLPQPPAPAPLPGSPGKGGQSVTTPGLTPPGQTSFPDAPGKKSGRRRYADSSDSSLLDKLREMSSESTEDDLGHMDSRNDKLRDLVDELQDRGYDASFAVASLHYAENPADGNPDFPGVSEPGFPEVPFHGSGPDPKEWFSDSASYVDKHERPDFEDVTDLGDDDIIKYNDSRSKPQQGPGHTSRLHQAGQPTAQDWDDGDWLGKAGDEAQEHMGDGGSMPGGLGQDGAALEEEAPELLALANRVGRGPRQAPRIDPGVRGNREAAMPRHLVAEDEGEDSYGEEPAHGSGDADILANFHRSAGADAVFASGTSPGDDNIAGAAQAFLRTAGRVFSPEDQRALEQESHVLGARNLPNDDDLAGTHYLLGL